MSRVRTFAGICLVLGLTSAAAQQPPDHDTTSLAKQTQSPVGDLVSVPL